MRIIILFYFSYLTLDYFFFQKIFSQVLVPYQSFYVCSISQRSTFFHIPMRGVCPTPSLILSVCWDFLKRESLSKYYGIKFDPIRKMKSQHNWILQVARSLPNFYITFLWEPIWNWFQPKFMSIWFWGKGLNLYLLSPLKIKSLCIGTCH